MSCSSLNEESLSTCFTIINKLIIYVYFKFGISFGKISSIFSVLLCHVCKEGRYLIINNQLVSPSGVECQCIDAYGMLVDIAEKLKVGFSREKARYLTIDDRM